MSLTNANNPGINYLMTFQVYIILQYSKVWERVNTSEGKRIQVYQNISGRGQLIKYPKIIDLGSCPEPDRAHVPYSSVT